MPRSAFVSLDGLDGTGKSTQCRLLVEWLTAQKVPVTACTDPGGTALGQELRKILLFGRERRIATTTEAMLFMASRAQLVDEVIKPALDRGEVVVSDGFLLASVVYQGHAGGVEPAKLWEVGLFATSGIEPDLTLILDAVPEIAMTRRASNGGASEASDVEARARTGFLFEAGRRPERYRLIDAAASLETVQGSVRREVGRLLMQRAWQLQSDGV